MTHTAPLPPNPYTALFAALRGDDRAARRAAVAQIHQHPDPQMIAGLITLLTHEDSELTQLAIITLAQLGSPAIRPLINVFASPDRRAHRHAKHALRLIGPEAIPALIAALQHELPRVRANAAWVLSEFTDPRTVEPLVDALHDEDREASLFIAAALSRTLAARFHDPGTFQLRVFTHIRETAEQAEIVPILLAALNDANDWERLIAACALGHTDDDRAVDPLLMLCVDDTAIIRSAAAAALGNLGVPRAFDTLQAALHDPDEDIWIRRSAALALGKLGTPACFDSLVHAARHADHWRVRERALQALGILCNLAALPVLRDALCDDDPAIRDAATDALVRFGDLAVEVLTHALRDADECVRQSAAEALAQIGTDDAQAALDLWRMKRRR